MLESSFKARSLSTVSPSAESKSVRLTTDIITTSLNIEIGERTEFS